MQDSIVLQCAATIFAVMVQHFPVLHCALLYSAGLILLPLVLQSCSIPIVLQNYINIILMFLWPSLPFAETMQDPFCKCCSAFYNTMMQGPIMPQGSPLSGQAALSIVLPTCRLL